MRTRTEPVLLTAIRWVITGLGLPVALYGAWALLDTLVRIIREGAFTKAGTGLTLGVVLLALGMALVRAAWKDRSLDRLGDRLR